MIAITLLLVLALGFWAYVWLAPLAANNAALAVALFAGSAVLCRVMSRFENPR